MSEDPVWRFLASEFASLRSQITTMSTSEAALLVLSLAAPGLLLLYGLFLAVVPDVSPTRPEELLFCSAEDLKHLRPLPLPLDPTRGPSPPPKIALSVVVPAFNEKLRLPAMLDEVHAFLSAPGTTRQEAFGAVPSSLRDWEVIVVDDGSEDGTDLVALTVGHEWVVKGWSQTGKGIGKGEIRVVKLENNRGKGGAVKHGVLHSRGARVLFADADGASSFPSVAALHSALDAIEIPYPTSVPASSPSTPSLASTASSFAPATSTEGLRSRTTKSVGLPRESEEESSSRLGVAIGSRAHLVSTDLVVKRSKIRNFLMHSFHLFVRTLGVRSIRDTQCGFKLFTRDAAALLFADMHLERWSFDVELLVLASSCTVQTAPPSSEGLASSFSRRTRSLPIPISETPIDWTEIAGSKISLIWDSLGMARDLIILRLCLGLTKWEVPRIVLPSSEKAK